MPGLCRENLRFYRHEPGRTEVLAKRMPVLPGLCRWWVSADMADDPASLSHPDSPSKVEKSPVDHPNFGSEVVLSLLSANACGGEVLGVVDSAHA